MGNNTAPLSSKPVLRRSTIVSQRSDRVVGWRLRAEVVKKEKKRETFV